jgi:hypothetical protein
MTENGTGDITIMTIGVVTTREGTMIKVMTATMIVVAMIAITVATVIAMTTTTDTSTSMKCRGLAGSCCEPWPIAELVPETGEQKVEHLFLAGIKRNRFE